MKQLKDPKAIFFYIVIALIIIAGIVMVATKGFNVELRYRANKKVTIAIGETADIEKIQEKADEIFGKGKSIAQVVEVYKDAVQITAKEITEEQKNSLVEKINEIYPKEKAEEQIDAKTVTIDSSENARLRDFLKLYVWPLAITTIVILAYYGIKYRKLGAAKVVIEAGLAILLTELVLLSILAIVRFPMGRLTSPLILLGYVLSLIYTSGKLIKAEKAKI